MQAKVKINFSFAKLVNKLPKMLDELIKDSGESSAKQSKSNIDKQTHGKPLHRLTLESRTKGNHPSGRNIRTSSTIPLKWSKNLYNNIKGTKKGLEMPEYGLLHHKGETTGSIKRPERPFIELKVSEKAVKNFKEGLNKNFRK